MKKYVIDVENKKAISVEEFFKYIEEGLDDGKYEQLISDYLDERRISTYDIFCWDKKEKNNFLMQFVNSLITGYDTDLFFTVEINN